ncbi:hypothetical protein [Alkalicoccus luteus]|uniref:DUF2834 domain-containing protein n=1 Tax=Alkalicoccus luteus TaxID=1237094 RepID=A0A969Q0R4_9BACI|nr:hypothetical protein [Alkalicoccus luteus]NJP39002.1 hypothetical protein [Alkalicoccus luteus]
MKRYAILFLLLTVYAVFFAPGEQNADDPFLSAIIEGRIQDLNPLTVAVFTMLGIYPLLFLLLLIPKDTRRVPAWLFALFSFGLGAFTILPYMAVRGRVTRESPRGPRFLQHALTHPAAYLLTGVAGAAVLLSALAGSITGYIDDFQQSHLVSVMSVDFLVVIWLAYDILKREWGVGRYAWLAFLPAVGPAVLLWMNRQKSV